MKSRRDFLKEAATGAVLLSSRSNFAVASALNQTTHASRSRIIMARDNALHAQGNQPDERRVLALLDRAIAAYTGRDKPVEAWKRIVPQGQVIGLKINCAGGKGISTHPVLINAIAERLQQAGVRPGNIVVWDLTAKWLETAGFTIRTDPNHVRCYGGDTAGWDEEPVACGSVKINLTKILTRECAMVINLPVLKEHGMTGVTFAMKNLYGAVQHPQDLHPGRGNPGLADLHCIPVVRNKVWFTIGDALSAQFEGGPGFRPENIWYPNSLVVGEDRVALDTIAWQMIEHKRADVGLPTLEAAGKPPHFIATAADAAHKLGTNDPKRINLIEV
jgi:uncharacterized protein (DUF362 family)